VRRPNCSALDLYYLHRIELKDFVDSSSWMKSFRHTLNFSDTRNSPVFHQFFLTQLNKLFLISIVTLDWFVLLRVSTEGCCIDSLSGASSLEKKVCRGRAAFDITFQHKSTISLNTRNRPMNFVKLPVLAATLVFCTECWETQVVTSSMINWCKFSALLLMTRSPPTAPSNAQYLCHSAIVPINQFMT